MRIKKQLIVVGAALFVLAALPASAVDFHGYFRSGIGGTNKGGAANPSDPANAGSGVDNMAAPKSGSKY